MKKLILAVALLALPTMAAAQLPEPIEGLLNPLVVAGANYLNDEPTDGSNRVRFFLTANVAGIKPFSGVPLYVGGVGIDIRTLPELGGIGESNGAGLSIPGLTYAFSGNQAVVQVGYSMAFNESAASGIYFGFGFALTPPQAGPSSLKAKREAKAKAKAKAKTADVAGPPAPMGL
jgi:hypothetical protein